MPLKRMDHVNVRTANLDAMIAWYGRVLGLTSGPRPNFSFPGAWLYLGDDAVIHLVGVSDAPSAGQSDLRLEHVAFAADDLPGFIERLRQEGLAIEPLRPPGAGIVQLHVRDPDGNHLHIDFNEAEAEGLEL